MARKATALIKEAAGRVEQEKEKKFRLSPIQEVILGESGIKGAEDMSRGTPGKQYREVLVDNGMLGGVAGAIVGGVHGRKNMKTLVTRAIQGGATTGAMYAGLAHLEYKVGEDWQRGRRTRRQST